ncbi:hypothetical protein BDV96DRAFT_597874 [Lophiotrema nucula]|uniref:Uncharacterized protein n=1 Tax=Lophiotrema nucula TaxID=690887 RepID=A0A6A5ZFZ5_9PLEO|nr:hypothetical protein BDV96DRAFT_597874 [Lophiotrema nucula]
MVSPALWTEKPSTSILIAQAVGLTASGFLFGANTNISYSFIPQILKAPAPLAADQWEGVFHKGHAIGPALAITSSAACAYVAYNRTEPWKPSFSASEALLILGTEDPASTAFKLNVAAAIIFPSIIPFTIAVLIPTNNKLFAKNKSLAKTALEDTAAEAGLAREETVHGLIEKWTKGHLVRSLITGVGFVLALWAAIDKREAVGFKDFAFQTGANRMG